MCSLERFIFSELLRQHNFDRMCQKARMSSFFSMSANQSATKGKTFVVSPEENFEIPFTGREVDGIMLTKVTFEVIDTQRPAATFMVESSFEEDGEDGKVIREIAMFDGNQANATQDIEEFVSNDYASVFKVTGGCRVLIETDYPEDYDEDTNLALEEEDYEEEEDSELIIEDSGEDEGSDSEESSSDSDDVQIIGVTQRQVAPQGRSNNVANRSGISGETPRVRANTYGLKDFVGVEQRLIERGEFPWETKDWEEHPFNYTVDQRIDYLLSYIRAAPTRESRELRMVWAGIWIHSEYPFKVRINAHRIHYVINSLMDPVFTYFEVYGGGLQRVDQYRVNKTRLLEVLDGYEVSKNGWIPYVSNRF